MTTMQDSATPLELDLVEAGPDQPRQPWGVFLTRPDKGSRVEPKLEARVTMYADRSRFFVTYPNGREEILSSSQFVALVLELKRSGRFLFDRKMR
ncbi:hypothetical protein [Phreatobacter sp. AB_2022a]|uniref:hypothetical protein n=1 Tax=Phreatobacter sp. AB_2022a TaxID=3003134 RepID=UPI002286F2BE|nr:hypothetical protein [Phreatobacter sp. AB_2022a]MCZ0734665.1 hypothetical protein [Phreatobacter sp. AB_2022a]